jgi:glycine/D-amino acid oxidase-like deaminating enzyme
MGARVAAADETPRAYLPLPDDQIRRRRIAVVGGGLMGTATAYAAARIGGPHVQVDLYEAQQIGHEGAASTDSTRLFRHAYGALPHYTRWAAETFSLWQDLERQSRRTLYAPTGSLWAAHAESSTSDLHARERAFGADEPLGFIAASQKAMTALGVPNEILDGREYLRRFPQFSDTGVVAALWDVNSALLFAREVLLALDDVSRRLGVTVYERKRAVEVAPTPAGCAVRFADGTSIEADVVVLAINGWTADVLPDIRLILTEQALHYVVPNPAVAHEFEVGRMPFCSWAGNGIWVFPANHGAVKIGDNYPTRTLRHPSERSMPDAAFRERVLALAIEQMPDLRDATLVQERACFYDFSSDGDFILDQWDDSARLIVACGFSGHGFKFGPLVGQRLAQFALSGNRPDDLAPFGLQRLSERERLTANSK